MLELITERLRSAGGPHRRDPGSGGRTILLVPTFSQASHIRRILLGRPFGVPGFFDETVLAFTGLAERILADRPIGEILSSLEQDLMIRRALLSIPSGVFTPVARHAGFRRAAIEFLKELKQNGRPFAELDQELEALAEERGGAVGVRLAAFRELFAAYEKQKDAARRLDHEDFLREARDAVRDRRWGRDLGLLLVDGFQNFTELERTLVLALADRAGETVVTLAFDPGLENEEDHNFSVAAQTRDFLRERGFTERVLTGNHRSPAPGLRELEAGLFAPDPAPLHPEGAIRILEGADPRDEADRVARTVLRLIRGEEGETRRYRDIVIIVRDVRSRRTLFADAFARHEIPLRIQGRESLLTHPAARAALALLTVAGGEAGREQVLGLLRADHLAAVALPEVDRLEFDLLEHGDPVDAAGWVERVGEHSPAGAEILGELFEAGAADPVPGAEVTETVLSLFRKHLVPIWNRGGAAALIRAEAAAFSALFTAVRELLEDLSREDGGVDLRMFTDRFAESIKGSVYGAHDRRLAVVDLIDAREARQWEAPVIIVSGLVEGEFPRSPREDIFLSDADRATVNRTGSLCLKERLLERHEERYLFYVAMTRAREKLYLTYPATDGAGRETMRSLYLDEALRLMPRDERDAALSRRPLSRALPEEDEVAHRKDLVCTALAGLARPFSPGTAEETTPLRAAALADLLRDDPAWRRAIATGLRYREPLLAVLPRPEGVAELQPPRRGRSATALEAFARCPFKHFAGRTLRLQGPPRVAAAGLDGLVLGNIAHEVLFSLFLPVVEGSPLPEEEALEQIFAEVFAKATAGISLGLAEDRSRRSLLAVLRQTLARERERLRGAAFWPRDLEVAFGPQVKRRLVIRSADGREVPIRGVMDRVDVAPDGGAVVIDYKYSKAGFGKAKQADAKAGRHLQLPLYLLALQEAFGLTPRGAWLYPLLGGRTSGYWLESGPKPDSPEQIDAEDLAELHRRTRRLVLDFDRRILEGEISARPFEDKECGRCDFADVCRFEPWMREERE